MFALLVIAGVGVGPKPYAIAYRVAHAVRLAPILSFCCRVTFRAVLGQEMARRTGAQSSIHRR